MSICLFAAVKLRGTFGLLSGLYPSSLTAARQNRFFPAVHFGKKNNFFRFLFARIISKMLALLRIFF
jgi:hypothetical protein